MKDELPEISKLAVRVACVLEEAVTRFARKHRYSAGEDLRKASRHVIRCTHLAWRAKQRKLQRIHELSVAVDDLKLEISVANVVKAWGSIGEMEAVARLVHDLGRQVGGWLNASHSTGQNAPAGRQVQRAPILSSRATPSGVAP